MAYKVQTPFGGLPARWADTDGLRYRAYSLYAGSSDQPDPAALVSGSLSSTSGLSTSISSFSVGTAKTYVWRGYFKPGVTSDAWQFRTTSKDGSFVWLDTTAEVAVASLNRTNAIVKNGGTHASTTVESSNLTLTAGLWYAIVIISANNTGTGAITFEYRRDGGSWSSNGTNNFFSDSRYVDGFGEDLYTATDEAQWGIVGNDGAIGYGSGSSPTNWIGYRSPGDAGSNDHYDIGYGKDGVGGNPRWVRTTLNNNYELGYSNDITDSSSWTSVNVTGRRYNVKWANDKWIAVGSTAQDDILASTDGATWSSVDVSGLGLTDRNITSLATDGGNNWIFGQGAKVYASSNHGVNWYLLKDFDDSSIIHEAAYSNNKWFVFREDVGGNNVAEKVGVAASASSGSWTDSADLNIGQVARAMFASVSTGSASESTVIVVNSDDVARSIDSGATFTKYTNALPHGSARSVTSDGDGNWVVTHDSGKISYSNDDGASWSDGTDSGAVTFGSATEDIDAVAVNKYLPL